MDTLKFLMIFPPMQVVHYDDQDFPQGHYIYHSTTFIFSQNSNLYHWKTNLERNILNRQEVAEMNEHEKIRLTSLSTKAG
jgi:hypothetical protein